MKKIGFIGAYDKSDLIINVAKMLQLLDYKVMVVDTTLMQKTRYIVPAVNPTKSYITEFENIDFAIGFESLEEIEDYLGTSFKGLDTGANNDMYDYVLIDIDSSEVLQDMEVRQLDNKYFVTSFDSYSLKKGLQIFDGIDRQMKLTKILFSYEISQENEERINNLSLEYRIEWSKLTFYFKITSEDNKVLQENQRFEKIKFKRLSNNYKDSLMYIIQDIDRSQSSMKLKKLMKD